MIKNIIFDMGQVLIKFDPDFFIERIGINDVEDKEVLRREVYKSIEWSMMDRGSITPEEASAVMEKRVPEHLKSYIKLLTCDWQRPIVPIQGAESLLRELKRNNYKLYLLSNAANNHSNYWNNIPGNDCFDGTLFSCDYHLVKPQPEIFKLLCNKFDLKPEECVFIDDTTINCEGAVYSGINAIVYHGDYDEVRKKLKEFGVNINN